MPAMDQDTQALSVLGILGFGGGMALVASVVSQVSLAATMALVLAAGILAARHLWAHSSPEKQEVVCRRLRAGLPAAVAALLAYDVSRWAVVEVLGLTFAPFEAFGAFGRAFWGEGATGWWVEASGIGVHVVNGLGFAIGYTLLAGRRGPLAGVVFALGLEAAMVVLYPPWLRIQAVDEFLQVSMVGHVVYGATLGWVARALLQRAHQRTRTESPRP